MSDGITDAWRDSGLTEKEEIRREMNRLISWGEDLAKAINDLYKRIEALEESKDITPKE
jgi:hypothetical protein